MGTRRIVHNKTASAVRTAAAFRSMSQPPLGLDLKALVNRANSYRAKQEKRRKLRRLQRDAVS